MDKRFRIGTGNLLLFQNIIRQHFLNMFLLFVFMIWLIVTFLTLFTFPFPFRLIFWICFGFFLLSVTLIKLYHFINKLLELCLIANKFKCFFSNLNQFSFNLLTHINYLLRNPNLSLELILCYSNTFGEYGHFNLLLASFTLFHTDKSIHFLKSPSKSAVEIIFYIIVCSELFFCYLPVRFWAILAHLFPNY